jgi:hypothetical protein
MTAPEKAFPYRRTAIPSGPRRTATVRTELHPQGYVEIGGCLHRAVWADPDRPPPAPGGLTDVVKGTGRNAGILLAVPPQASRPQARPPRERNPLR